MVVCHGLLPINATYPDPRGSCATLHRSTLTHTQQQGRVWCKDDVGLRQGIPRGIVRADGPSLPCADEVSQEWEPECVSLQVALGWDPLPGVPRGSMVPRRLHPDRGPEVCTTTPHQNKNPPETIPSSPSLASSSMSMGWASTMSRRLAACAPPRAR